MAVGPIVPAEDEAESKSKPRSGVADQIGDPVISEEHLPRALQDELDSCGVSAELLRSWAARQAKVLPEPAERKRPWEVMPAQAREGVLRFLHGLADLVGFPQRGQSKTLWFDAVLLLDVYCLRERTPIEALPAACAAVVNLLQKFANSEMHIGAGGLSNDASNLAKRLRSLGHHASDTEVTAEAIRVQEHAVLRSLGWQINLPSVHTWISTLRDRFNILSCRICSQSIDFAFATSTSIAGVLVTRNVVSTSMSPQRMANGLFCLAIVGVGLVPLEALRPSEFCTAAEWEKLYLESWFPREGAVPKCQMPAFPTYLADLLRLVQVAAWSCLATLQVDAHAVAVTMRNFALSLQNKHAQCARLDARGT